MKKWRREASQQSKIHLPRSQHNIINGIDNNNIISNIFQVFPWSWAISKSVRAVSFPLIHPPRFKYPKRILIILLGYFLVLGNWGLVVLVRAKNLGW